MIGGSEPEGALSCSSGRAEATQPGGRLHAEHFNPKREQRSNSMVTKRSRGRRGGSPDSSSLGRNHGCGDAVRSGSLPKWPIHATGKRLRRTDRIFRGNTPSVPGARRLRCSQCAEKRPRRS